MLIVMLVLFAMPLLASTPEEENAPKPTLDDIKIGFFQLSDEELGNIEGQVILAFYDINKPGGGEDPLDTIKVVTNQSGNPNSPNNPGYIPGTSDSVVDTSGLIGSSSNATGGWSDCGASVPK